MSYTFQRSSLRFLWLSGAIVLGLLMMAQNVSAGTISTESDITLRINDDGGTARDITLKSGSTYQLLTVNDANIQFNLISGEEINLDQGGGYILEADTTTNVTTSCQGETNATARITRVGTTTISVRSAKCASSGGGGGGTESTPSPSPSPAPSPAPSATPSPAPSPAPATTPSPAPAPVAPVSTPTVTVPPPVSPIFKSGLGIGMTNDEVKRLQILLATDSVIYPEGITSGYFGSLTKAAVGRFQLQYNVVGSASEQGYGYVGPKTRAKLQEVFETGVSVPVAPAPETPATGPSAPVVVEGVSAVFATALDMGMKNADVKRLQTLLATDPALYPESITSGYFGSLTKAAVGRFQMKHGLVSSASDAAYGFVGPKTRAKLQEVYGGTSSAPSITPPSTNGGSADDAAVNSLKAQIEALQKMLDQLKAQ